MLPPVGTMVTIGMGNNRYEYQAFDFAFQRSIYIMRRVQAILAISAEKDGKSPSQVFLENSNLCKITISINNFFD